VNPVPQCILIVDDDASIRQLLVTFLRRRGFQLLEAHDGRDALVKMRTGRADLVVMDLAMPEVSGWDVLEERMLDPALVQTPMIVITANNVREVTAMMVGKHVDAVISKPFDLATLLQAVTVCLHTPDLSTPIAA